MNYSKRQKGFAIGYVYGLVALLAILGAILAQTSGVKQDSVEQKRMADSILSQAYLVRNAMFLCQISYPSGGVSGGTDNRFPASTMSIRDASCPGSSGIKVFGGVSDVIYPKAVRGFSEWSLTNDVTGVSIGATALNASDKNAQKAISLAHDEMGTWQSDVTGSSIRYYLKK